MKKILKKVTAVIAAFGCLCASSIYASASFNPTYTGRFVATKYSYMTVSSEDAVMTKIIYPVSSTTNRFMTIEGASSFIFSNEKFSATYNKNGTLTTLEGEEIGTVSKPVIVQTNQIEVKTNWLGMVTDVCVIYNGLYYSRE